MKVSRERSINTKSTPQALESVIAISGKRRVQLDCAHNISGRKAYIHELSWHQKATAFFTANVCADCETNYVNHGWRLF